MKASPHMRARAKVLRKSPTLSERRIWNWLRNRNFGGYKLRRQVPLGPYVADFYCAELKVIIEIDGMQHETPWAAAYDTGRTLDLQAHGIDVVRISNELIVRDSATAEQIIGAAFAARAATLRR